MNLKLWIGIALALAGLLGAALVVGRNHSRPPVTVTLRIAVQPSDQSSFVAGQARSAKFKYLVGKESGVKPVLAQKLSIKSVPNSSLLEAQLRVSTLDEGRRYAGAFVETLQDLCREQAQIALAEKSIR